MSKKIKSKSNIEISESKHRGSEKQSSTNSMTDTKISNSWIQQITQGWIPYVVISVLGFVLYFNTFNHEYALDDDIIICKNEYVLKGLSGLGDIMKKDVFDSYYKSMNLDAQLAGGRYRPFSVATFALEQEFIGTFPNGLQRDAWDKNSNKIGDSDEDLNKDGLFNDKDVKVKGMGLRHVDNVLLYILGVCIIYLFLSRFIFKENKLLALLSTLIFLAHPLHTEVVANVKSRDEILSLLFIVLTLHLSFVYAETKKMSALIWACVSYFIALLSKEYGVTLLVLVPLALWLYHKDLKLSKLTLPIALLFVTFLIYYGIRSTIVLDIGSNSVQDMELLNNPFLLATESQAMATKIFINLKYLLLLLFPTTLSSDYSYNAIPYKDFSNIEVILSILLLVGSVIAFLWTVKKRNWLAFPIGFALAHLFLINNTFFNIGATMGERLVYHTSLGTSMLLVFGLSYLFVNVLKLKPNAVLFIALPILVLFSMKTIARNPAWKNDTTLALTDVKTCPNSALLNGNACIRLIELSEFPANKPSEKMYLDSAARYGYKAIQLHPKYVTTLMNLGMIKMKQSQVDSAAFYWDQVKALYPTHPNVPQINQFLGSKYYQVGLDLAKQKDFPNALAKLLLAYKYQTNNGRLCYDIGVVYANMQNIVKAKEFWKRGIQLAPNDVDLQRVNQ